MLYAICLFSFVLLDIHCVNSVSSVNMFAGCCGICSCTNVSEQFYIENTPLVVCYCCHIYSSAHFAGWHLFENTKQVATQV